MLYAIGGQKLIRDSYHEAVEEGYRWHEFGDSHLILPGGEPIDGQESYLAAALNLLPVLSHNPQLMEGSCYCLRTFRTGDLNGAANVNVVSCSRLADLVDGTDGLR